MEYLTQDNITGFFVAMGYVIFAIRVIVKWTASKKDDEYLAKLDADIDWVKEKAGGFYTVVEELCKAGVISKEAKSIKFLELLNAAYKQANKQDLPKVLTIPAQVVVEGKAAIDKAKAVRDDLSLQIEQLKAKIKGEIGPNDSAQ